MFNSTQWVDANFFYVTHFTGSNISTLLGGSEVLGDFAPSPFIYKNEGVKAFRWERNEKFFFFWKVFFCKLLRAVVYVRSRGSRVVLTISNKLPYSVFAGLSAAALLAISIGRG